MWLAAAEFRAVWSRAYSSLFPARSLEMPSPIRLHGAPSTWRLDALTKLRLLRVRLGAEAYDIVELVVIDDPSWAALGRRLAVDPKTARLRAITALRRLAE
jgi:hypothetical protein